MLIFQVDVLSKNSSFEDNKNMFVWWLLRKYVQSFPSDGGVVANMAAFQAVVPSSILGRRM